MGEGRPDQHRMQLLRQGQIVGVAGRSFEEPLILLSAHGLTDAELPHGLISSIAARPGMAGTSGSLHDRGGAQACQPKGRQME